VWRSVIRGHLRIARTSPRRARRAGPEGLASGDLYLQPPEREPVAAADRPSQRPLTRIIDERFCCNRGFAAATCMDAAGVASMQAGSSLGRSTYCFKYASL